MPVADADAPWTSQGLTEPLMRMVRAESMQRAPEGLVALVGWDTPGVYLSMATLYDGMGGSATPPSLAPNSGIRMGRRSEFAGPNGVVSCMHGGLDGPNRYLERGFGWRALPAMIITLDAVVVSLDKLYLPGHWAAGKAALGSGILCELLRATVIFAAARVDHDSDDAVCQATAHNSHDYRQLPHGRAKRQTRALFL